MVVPAGQFLTFALAGGGIIVASAPERPVVWWRALLVGAVLAALRLELTPLSIRAIAASPTVLPALVGAGFLASAASRGTARPETLAGAFAIAIGFLIVAIALGSRGIPWTPRYTLDGALLAADSRFGFLPSFEVARWFRALPRPLAQGIVAIYHGLPVDLALVYAAGLRGALPRKRLYRLMTAFAGVALAGPLFYWICPGTGPAYAFPDFPASLPTFPIEGTIFVTRQGAPCNAMPSLHIVLTLLLWRGVRDATRWLRVVALTFLVGTAIATLGMGEHYFVDLVAAVPLAAAAELFSRGAAGGRGCLGVLITAVWIAVVRLGIQLPELGMWTMAAATVAASVWLWQASPAPGTEVPRERVTLPE
jgi:hypothetical protein